MAICNYLLLEARSRSRSIFALKSCLLMYAQRLFIKQLFVSLHVLSAQTPILIKTLSKAIVCFFTCFVSTNPNTDKEFRSMEDLSSTGSTETDRHARALTAVSAYGASVALNKTRQRPVSAKIASSQGELKAVFSLVSRRIHAKKNSVCLEHGLACFLHAPLNISLL